MTSIFSPFEEISNGESSLGIARKITEHIVSATGERLVELWAAGLALLDTRYPHDEATMLRDPIMPQELVEFEASLKSVSID